MILRPSLAGAVYRFRLSNRYGDRPLRIERASLAVQAAAGALVPGSARQARFAGASSVVIPAGAAIYSDAVLLPDAGAMTPAKLALSFHIAGPSGALTWHAEAFTTSYITAPDSGDHVDDESELPFAFATSSWFLVDALDVWSDPAAAAIVALGDSITDGWTTTMNGDDRWTDILSRRLQRAWPGRFTVVNQGLAGNRVAAGDWANPSALARFERDVIGLSGVAAVILFIGTNDLGSGLPEAAIIAAMRAVAERARDAGLKIFAATILPRGPASLPLDSVEGQQHIEARRRVNTFIRSGAVFDGVIDFAACLADPADLDRLDPAFIPNASGPGDGLHPNRLANLRMAEAVALSIFAGVRANT